jgi:hypothetical protein
MKMSDPRIIRSLILALLFGLLLTMFFRVKEGFQNVPPPPPPPDGRPPPPPPPLRGLNGKPEGTISVKDLTATTAIKNLTGAVASAGAANLAGGLTFTATDAKGLTAANGLTVTVANASASTLVPIATPVPRATSAPEK